MAAVLPVAKQIRWSGYAYGGLHCEWPLARDSAEPREYLWYLCKCDVGLWHRKDLLLCQTGVGNASSIRLWSSRFVIIYICKQLQRHMTQFILDCGPSTPLTILVGQPYFSGGWAEKERENMSGYYGQLFMPYMHKREWYQACDFCIPAI